MGFTRKEIAATLKLDEKIIKKLIEKHGIHPLEEKKGNSYTYTISEFEKFTKSYIPALNLINDSFKLLKQYDNNKLAIPFGIKGLIGELFCLDQMIKNIDEPKIIFLGGSYPQYDIILNGKKIQVKTKFYKHSQLDHILLHITKCPSVSVKSIEEFDFLILVEIFHDNWKLDQDKTRVYIFTQDEFKRYSSRKGCWTKNSVTIWCPHQKFSTKIIDILKKKNRKSDKILLFYNATEYHDLFLQSKDNWNKIS